MTWGNMGTLRAEPGQRDAIVAALVRHKPELAASGCLVYEVGTNPASPDLVYVLEVWESAEAHRASLGIGTIRDAIHSVLPLLDGEMVSLKFDIVGSPLDDAASAQAGSETATSASASARAGSRS